MKQDQDGMVVRLASGRDIFCNDRVKSAGRLHDDYDGVTTAVMWKGGELTIDEKQQISELMVEVWKAFSD